MTKQNFPYIAATLGILLTIVVLKGSVLREEGRTMLPLLTLLIVCEFGAILTAIGSYIGAREFLSKRKFSAPVAVSLLCAVLSIHFITRGIQLWPN